MFDTLTFAQKMVLAAVVLLAMAAALVNASGRLRAAPDAAEPAGYNPPVSGNELMIVHVVGAVVRPGLYRLESGSRVRDAVAAAGGFAATARPGSVNLASWVTDGEQVFVETRQATPAPVMNAQPTDRSVSASAPRAHMVSASAAGPRSAPARSATPTANTPPTTKPRVCINTAGLEELQQLPGIGPVLAKRILYYRLENGRFRSFEQLDDVEGIGRRTLADIRDCATLN